MFKKGFLTEREKYVLDGYFRAANYVSACQLYLMDNPLLRRPLSTSDIKPRLVGHWGTVPGQNFIITHLNRLIKKHNLNMMLVVGPGHGGNAAVSNCYLEGTYSKIYKNIPENEEGLKKLFKQFSFPGGISSHVAPETPGSINEGGELGYSLAHAYGSVLDNKDLITACIIGDGEAETAPLQASFHINKIINPEKDGIVLPILHLNGYKISNPTLLSRITYTELVSYFKGCGYTPYLVRTSENEHDNMAIALEKALLDIRKIKRGVKIPFPIIIFKSKKGWTGPKQVNDLKIEGTFRAHQIPLSVDKNTGENLDRLEKWLKGYKPEELFDDKGKLREEFKSIIPDDNHKLFANKNANGGLLLKELKVPNYKNYAVPVKTGNNYEDMRILGKFIRDIIKKNKTNFRVFSPDEALSNRLSFVFEETNRQFDAKTFASDEFLNKSGNVIDSILSEHICEGLLEGYLLTGRHGLFASYEAFIRVVDSMISQHAKWLKVSNDLQFRKDISSLNLVLTSHIWQQDHNGYTHQEPGLLNHVATKKHTISRIYLPPDTNTLLCVFNHAIKSKNKINVIVASKQPSKQWLDIETATKETKKGINEWSWASNNPEKAKIILACAGDTPTLEIIAASKIIAKFLPTLPFKVINVIDLLKLKRDEESKYGLTDKEFNKLFTENKPVIFNFHGYSDLIYSLVYNRENKNFFVHGYNEEGTITTPFDMRVQNKIDRFNICLEVLKHIPESKKTKELEKYCKKLLTKHKSYIKKTGIDIDEVRNFDFD